MAGKRRLERVGYKGGRLRKEVEGGVSIIDFIE